MEETKLLAALAQIQQQVDALLQGQRALRKQMHSCFDALDARFVEFEANRNRRLDCQSAQLSDPTLSRQDEPADETQAVNRLTH